MFGTFSRHRRVANPRVELTPKAEGTVGSLAEPFWITLPTVDGKNPKQPPGMYPKPCKLWDKLSFSTGERRISSFFF